MELDLQYEHIDWNDIVEAEQSGDQDTLELLRNRSVELKRSFSLPSPSPPRPTPPEGKLPFEDFTNYFSDHTPKQSHSSPKSGHFKVPRKCRKSLTPKALSFKQRGRLQRSQSHRENFDLYRAMDENYPHLSALSSDPPPTSPQALSYAEVACSRNAKRTASERLGLSPIELPTKRSALSSLVKTPMEMRGESQVTSIQSHIMSTPQETTSEVIDEDMDTPDIDRLARNAVHVQRRLFSFIENPLPNSSKTTQSQEKLTDSHRLTQRQKQIDFGKNTIGYETYIQTVPRWKREKNDPQTPNKYDSCSTRSWQGRIRVWRRSLHKWDPPGGEGEQQFTTEEAALCDIDMSTDWGSVD